MKALQLNGPGQLPQFQETADPAPAKGEVIVQVKAAAMNYRDVWIVRGMYPGIVYPIILGSDGAGLHEGREVLINPGIGWGSNPAYRSKNFHILGSPKNGTFAGQVAVDASQLYDKPPHLSWEQAAALPLGGLTTYRGLFSLANLQEGEKVLISGIGGGVALIAFQLAIAGGAEVYVTSGSDEKIQKAIDLGAKGGVNYTKDGWGKSLKAVAGSFDVIVDSAGGSGFSELMNLTAMGARIVVYGGTCGAIPNVSPQIIFWKQVSILGTTMGTDREFADMLAFVNRHKVVPVIDKVFDLKDGAAGFERMKQGLQFGKVVFNVNA